MIHAEIPRRRPWAGIAWLAALVSGALVALLNIYVGILLIVFSTALVLLYVVAQRPPALRHASTHIDWQPLAQGAIVTAEGVEQVALVTPVANEDYTMVLTTEGYKLIDQTGRVVYSLKS